MELSALSELSDINLVAAPSTRGPFDPEAIGTLAACLALTAPDAATLAAAVKRVGADRLFTLADQLRLKPALAMAMRDRGVFADIPAVALPDGRRSMTKLIADEIAEHERRRTILTERLAEIVAAANREGIEPLLIKGARALWLGAPRWRTMLDLDLLAAGADADRLQRVVMALGYGEHSGLAERPNRHHLAPLLRRDTPGPIEIHRRAGNRYAEPLLPTRELESVAEVRLGPGGASARLLPTTDHILHGLAHHHAGHGGDARGLIDFRGLYEFAFDVAALDADGRFALTERARRHPRLLAALDLWVVGAHALFAMPIQPPLAAPADAAARWRQVFARMTGARHDRWRYPGYAEELAMGFDAGRAARIAPGGGPLARLALGWRAGVSLLPKNPYR
jgi:hypothetical protein